MAHVIETTTHSTTDRYAMRFVWGVWAILLVAALTYIGVFGYDMPFLDEYELVDALTGRQTIDLAWLWSQHNEHRIVLPRLLYLALAWLTDADFRTGMYFNCIALGGIAAAMILAARRLRGRTSYADVFFPLAMLHLGHCENLLWSFQIEFVLSTFLVCGLLLLVIRSRAAPSWWGIVVAALCLCGLPLTGAHGLPFVPPLAAWLVAWAWQHRSEADSHGRKKFVVALSAAAAALFLVGWYFIDYVPCDTHPPSSKASRTIKLVRQFLAISGGPGVISYWSYLRLSGQIGMLIGIAVLAWRWWQAPNERVRTLGFMAILIGVAGLAFGIGWGRGGINNYNGFAFRYVTLAVPWICCLYFMAQASRSRILAGCVQTGLAITLALLLKENTRIGIHYADERRQNMEAVVADVRAGCTTYEIARKHAFLYPLPDVLGRRLEKLRAAGIGPWRELAGSSTTLLGPVLDIQIRNLNEIGVGADHGAIAETVGDGSNLNVNLLDGPPEPAHQREESAILRRGL